eukprot:10057081-Lingulodinium_polyedra.AAC.1
MLVEGPWVRGPLLGHAVEVRALQRHDVAPRARVTEMDPRGDFDNPVGGNLEDLLLEGHVGGLGTVGQAKPGASLLQALERPLHTPVLDPPFGPLRVVDEAS